MVGLNHQPVWHCHNICYPGAFARWSLQICSWTFVPHQVQFFGNNSATQTDPKRWNYLGNTWKNHRYRVDPGGICSVIFCGIYISWYFLDFLEIIGLWTGIPMCSPSFGGEKGSDWVPGSKTLECIELMRENGHKSSQVVGRCGSAVALVIYAVWLSDCRLMCIWWVKLTLGALWSFII